MNTVLSSNMSEKEQVLQLMESLQKGLKKFTVEELNEKLNSIINSDFDKQKNKERYISLILSLVCKEYGITRQALIKSKKHRQARNIAYCILHINLGLPVRYIAKRIFFLTWHNSVAIAIKYYNTLNTEIAPDREFDEILKRIQANVIKKIKIEI